MINKQPIGICHLCFCAYLSVPCDHGFMPDDWVQKRVKFREEHSFHPQELNGGQLQIQLQTSDFIPNI